LLAGENLSCCLDVDPEKIIEEEEKRQPQAFEEEE
jgi:hypothetical protein